jgi:hypothetical protein
LSAPSAKTVTVNYAAASGTATSGQDFDASQGVINFGPGVTSRTISVNIRGDVTFEPDETFFVNLSNPAEGTIADGQGQGTIVNDDPVPAITILDASASEVVGADSTDDRNGAPGEPFVVDDHRGFRDCRRNGHRRVRLRRSRVAQ